jgi:hypothetical protein
VSTEPIPDEESVHAAAQEVQRRRMSLAILVFLGVVLAAVLGYFVIS